MALHLTPDMLEATYDLLRVTTPFNGWHLPEHDDLSFRVSASPTWIGDCMLDDEGGFRLSISVKGVSQLHTLVFYMAHEMVHLYQMMNKRDTQGVAHNADWRKLALRVCSIHGFDFKLFC